MLSIARLTRSLGVVVAPTMRSFQTLPALNASALAQLRKKTGYSLSLCKKALTECDQDVGKAKKWLDEQAQQQGWNKANKLEGRNTTQGLVGVQVTPCRKAAAMIELNSETDFVARNKQFHVLLNAIVDTCLGQAQRVSSGNDDVTVKTLNREELAGIKMEDGKTLADLVALNIGQIGENLILRRAVMYKVNDAVADANEEVKLSALTHPSANIHNADVAYGRFGSVMAYAKDKRVEAVLPEGQTVGELLVNFELPFFPVASFFPESLARQICQHIIGMNPTSVGDVNEVKREAPVKEEKTEVVEEPKGEGVQADEDWSLYESDALVNNSTELVHQPFLTNSTVAVKDVLVEAGVGIKNFVRFEVGQKLTEDD